MCSVRLYEVRREVWLRDIVGIRKKVRGEALADIETFDMECRGENVLRLVRGGEESGRVVRWKSWWWFDTSVRR